MCAAHTHHKVTSSTGSASDRGTTSMVIVGLAYSSGQRDSLDEDGGRESMSA